MALDFIVIGGGSGGSACAKRAAEYGAKVVLVERGASRDAVGRRMGAGVGGTCVNVGCVPKKLMYSAAHHREMMVGSASTAAGYGFDVPSSAGRVDWPRLKAARDNEVKRLNGHYESSWKKLGIEVVTGLASFVDKHTVAVELPGAAEPQLLTAPHILIACGGEPAMLDMPGGELAISSDGFFDLP